MWPDFSDLYVLIGVIDPVVNGEIPMKVDINGTSYAILRNVIRFRLWIFPKAKDDGFQALPFTFGDRLQPVVNVPRDKDLVIFHESSSSVSSSASNRRKASSAGIQ